MAAKRTDPTVTRLGDGRVLVAGGRTYDSPTGHHDWSSAEVFDPRTGRWSDTRPMRGWRLDAGAVLLADGRVLVLGGQVPPFGGPNSNDAPGPSNPIDGYDVEVHDPTSGTFAATGREAVTRERRASSCSPTATSSSRVARPSTPTRRAHSLSRTSCSAP